MRRPATPHGGRDLVRTCPPYKSRPGGHLGAPTRTIVRAGVPLCPRRLCPLTQGRQGNMDEVHTPTNVWAFASCSRAGFGVCWGRIRRALPPVAPCPGVYRLHRYLSAVAVFLASRFAMERGRGIEPPSPAWKAGILAVVRPSHGAGDGARTRSPSITNRPHIQLCFTGMVPGTRRAVCHVCDFLVRAARHFS